MSRSSVLILLGVLVALTPFSGLPIEFRTFLSVLFGVLVLAAGFFLRTKEVALAAAGTPEVTKEPLSMQEELVVVQPGESPVAQPEPPHDVSPI